MLHHCSFISYFEATLSPRKGVYHVLFIQVLLYLQKYIEEKIGPDEKLPWTQSVAGKGFTGEVSLTCSTSLYSLIGEGFSCEVSLSCLLKTGEKIEAKTNFSS